MSFARGRELVLTPGPSVMPDRVLRAMQRPAPNIYEGELVEITDSILRDLGRLAGTAGETALYVSYGKLPLVTCLALAMPFWHWPAVLSATVGRTPVE